MRRTLLRLMDNNSSRHRLYLENSAFAQTIPAGSLVLDAGAGPAPYKHLFSHARYESADFTKFDVAGSYTTYVCDLRNIPVEDRRFDFIVFNQVMEHLPQPDRVLKELFRILKPGGRMIYTAPLFYEEHQQPYDFYRYTQFAVRFLFDAAGFKIERLDWMDGYYATVGYQLNTMSRYLPKAPLAIAPGALGVLLSPFMFLLKAQFALLSILFHKLEMRHKITTRGYPKNYIAIVIRPSQ
jgi:SAM-dependent methyltransferase